MSNRDILKSLASNDLHRDLQFATSPRSVTHLAQHIQNAFPDFGTSFLLGDCRNRCRVASRNRNTKAGRQRQQSEPDNELINAQSARQAVAAVARLARPQMRTFIAPTVSRRGMSLSLLCPTHFTPSGRRIGWIAPGMDDDQRMIRFRLLDGDFTNTFRDSSVTTPD